jgi:predicted dehydrogenase
MSTWRIGIIGSGAMAAERLGAFRQRAADVVGFAARNSERARTLSSSLRVKHHVDWQSLLADVDAVVICLPNHLHASAALDALASRKHVLVEYPLCCNFDELSRLQRAAVAADRVLMVGNTIIHEAPFLYLQRHKHRLGSLLSAASRVVWYSSNTLSSAWYMQPASRGPLFAALHYHHIEYYRRLFGEPLWVLAKDESNDSERIAGGTLLMGHADDRTSCVQWYLSASGDGLARGMWLTGATSSLSIVAQNAGNAQAIWDGGGSDELDVIPDEWGVGGSCEDFLNAINGDLDHRSRLASDVATLQIAWCATRSAQLGQQVCTDRRLATAPTA